MSSIHAHEVMNLMLASEQSFTRDSLSAALTEKFGADARFHSCSAKDMSVTGVIDFLEGRGKFVDQGDGFTTCASKMCQHH